MSIWNGFRIKKLGLFELALFSNTILCAISLFQVSGFEIPISQANFELLSVVFLFFFVAWLIRVSNPNLLLRLIDIPSSDRTKLLVAALAAGAVIMISPIRIPPEILGWVAICLALGPTPIAQFKNPDQARHLVWLALAIQTVGLVVLCGLPWVPAIIVASSATLHLIVHQRLWPAATAYLIVLLAQAYGGGFVYLLGPVAALGLVRLHHSDRIRTHRLYARLFGANRMLKSAFAGVMAIQETSWDMRRTLRSNYHRAMATMTSFELMNQLEQHTLALRQSDLDGFKINGDPSSCQAILFWHSGDFLKQILLLLHCTKGDVRPIILPRRIRDTRFEAALDTVVSLCGREIAFPRTAPEHISALKRFRGQKPIWVIGAEFALLSDQMGGTLRRKLRKCQGVLAQNPSARSEWTVTSYRSLDQSAYVAQARDNADEMMMNLGKQR